MSSDSLPDPSRAMFVARLENMRDGPPLGVDDVLALLNDCDMLAEREARADSAVPSSHVSGTDHSKESILREALARLYAVMKSEGEMRMDRYADWLEFHRAMAAARSALAGMPPNASGDETGAHLGAVQRPRGTTERSGTPNRGGDQ